MYSAGKFLVPERRWVALQILGSCSERVGDRNTMGEWGAFR